MASDDIVFKDQNVAGADVFKPRVRDLGNSVRQSVVGLADKTGTDISPATDDTLIDIKTRLPVNLGLQSANTSLGVVVAPSETSIHNQISNIGNSAPVIIVAKRPGRSSIRLTKFDSVDLYLGNSTVTTSTGDLFAGDKGAFVIYNDGDAIYCITSTGTANVSYRECF